MDVINEKNFFILKELAGNCLPANQVAKTEFTLQICVAENSGYLEQFKNKKV